MKAVLSGFGIMLLAFCASATERWSFDKRIALTPAPAAGVFHHLEGSGRRHIAVSDTRVGITWEDNSRGDPQVYFAHKPIGAETFEAIVQLSTGSEAYEPAVTAVGSGTFAVAWEQDGTVYARAVTAAGAGRSLSFGKQAGHASIAAHDGQIYLTWRERRAAGWYLQFSHLRADAAGNLQLVSARAVETEALATPVLFPAIAVNEAGLGIAWEDRRAGHTRLLFSHSSNRGLDFAAPQNLNEFLSDRNQYDKGNGVTRVALASFAADEIIAAWMDKRRGGAGYGIYASLGAEGGDNYGPNERVHGAEGDRQPHYNPAVAGNADGDFIVAWDDFRRGDSDIWLSNYNDDEEWSEDHAPAVASGPGEQSHPAVAIDNQGRLHLLWMERADLNAPSRLYYSLGQPRQ